MNSDFKCKIFKSNNWWFSYFYIIHQAMVNFFIVNNIQLSIRTHYIQITLKYIILKYTISIFLMCAKVFLFFTMVFLIFTMLSGPSVFSKSCKMHWKGWIDVKNQSSFLGALIFCACPLYTIYFYKAVFLCQLKKLGNLQTFRNNCSWDWKETCDWISFEWVFRHIFIVNVIVVDIFLLCCQLCGIKKLASEKS